MQTQPDPTMSDSNTATHNFPNQSQVSLRHSSGVDTSEVRKSARFQEQEDLSKAVTSKKSFRDSIKFDASLYQSGDDDEDSAEDQPMHTNQTSS